MDLIFALAFLPDKMLGLIPAPYLLKAAANGNYTIFKRLTGDELLSDPDQDERIGKIIQLSGMLSHDALNRKFNKKHHKTNLTSFLETSDEKTRKHVLSWIDRIKSDIIHLAKEADALIFFKEGHYSTVYKEDLIGISKEPAHVVFGFERKGGNLYYRLRMYHQDKRIDLTNKPVTILTNINPAIIYNHKLIFFDNPHFNGNKLKPFLTKDEIVVNEKLQGVFFSKFIAPVVKNFEYDIKGFDLIEVKTDVSSFLVIEKTFTNKIILTPEFQYGEYRVAFYKPRQVFINVVEKDGQYALQSTRRDMNLEKAMLAKLESFGFKQHEKYFTTANDQDDIYQFTEQFAGSIPKLEKAGFRVVNHLFSSEVNYAAPAIEYKTKQKQDWFDLHIVITVGEFKIKFSQLRHHILNRIREYKLPDGRLFIIPDAWFSDLYGLAKRTKRNNVLPIHKSQLHLLKQNKLIQPDKTISEQLSKLEVREKTEIPPGITATLRDYQKTGFRWLYHMTQNRLGVCLADDMGLGKTLQVITVLQKYFENKVFEVPQQPSGEQQLSLFDHLEEPAAKDSEQVVSALLIVPRSLIFNWIEELRKFAPSLTYAVYHGSNRQDSLKNIFNRVHIIITTYGMVRQDIEELKEYPFSYIVADESQAIKNPHSKIFRAVTSLHSEFRIAITGTPIENHLTDLWAQMTFLNKNILGNQKYFEENYAMPVSKNSDGPEARELRSITGPLVLRRLKKDVARELPEKIEQVIYCEMTEEQKQLYENEKSAIRNQILFTKEKEATVMHALAMLNRLRQIAIDPRLVDLDTEIASGKFEALVNTMDNLIGQGHKFLVFSSFVKHLNLFKTYFETSGILYSMLTGSDRKRKEIVENFQNNPEIKPFLISIKAGGLGLNITAANYVLIVDPWWNPFVETQAIDRTHRIGQTQKVMVYRFITKDTVEEKMMMLQQSKLKLSDTLIDQNRAGKLEMGEIEKLLE